MKPKIIYTLLEPTRAVIESLSLLFPIDSKASKPKNILVLPGFLATDKSTLALRKALTKMGHSVGGWGKGLNTGLDGAKIEELASLVRQLGDNTVLIGHSLGGIYGREIAKSCPNVDKVICICSPVNVDTGEVMTTLEVIYSAINDVSDTTKQKIREPPKCDSVHLYSMTDGVVSGDSCQQFGGVNIEIFSSHCGAVLNRKVIKTIGELI